ncbi:hypothetical protein FHR90_001183 [Endobacter medicaginis]|uniref:Uncharacterized protein n=1 Tax=Endobacter medicaginis TaxID=1181271 RepID=A0A839UYY3_9PROT|nr:hypothetical protein [Endobacter medicaginis]MBB3173360.1 hypothetical protein [Endobacter medicaginis]MCX5477008.1 hypothetical protein [Endobacter medicaginis]
MLDGCTDLIAMAAACLRAGGAPVRVAPARHGTALLVAHRPHNAVLRIIAPGPVAALGLQTAGAGPVELHLDPDAVRRAIADLPKVASPPGFPAGFVLHGGGLPRIAAIRVFAALASCGLDAAPDWPGTIDPASLPLLRMLLAAARECAATPPASWLARLADALDAQWRAGQGPLMRLIDSADPDATTGRLALAGRAATLLARAAAAGLV